MGSKYFAVAIDGPSGAGKSTVAKILAQKLGYMYVDTGAMYRSVALYGIKNGYNLDDIGAVERFIGNIRIEIKHIDSVQRIFLNGEDVTDSIRTQDVADGSSKVAAIGRVRAAMTAIQRDLAKSNDVVMDGRDIGTNVLPEAQVKIYMDADVKTRASRRLHELGGKGIDADIGTVEKEIIERDLRDKNRENSPLRMAEDAIFLDTGNMSAEEAAKKIQEIIIQKRGCV